jgi:hypothetical protein
MISTELAPGEPILQPFVINIADGGMPDLQRAQNRLGGG